MGRSPSTRCHDDSQDLNLQNVHERSVVRTTVNQMQWIGSLALQHLWHERGRRPGETFFNWEIFGILSRFFHE